MGRPVGAHYAGPVYGYYDWKPLYADVVKDLVVRPLEKCGIYGRNRNESLLGEPGREGYGVLLGYADVEEPGGKSFGEFFKPRSFRHRGGYGHNPFIRRSEFHERGAENVRVASRRRFRGVSGFRVELADPVK